MGASGGFLRSIHWTGHTHHNQGLCILQVKRATDLVIKRLMEHVESKSIRDVQMKLMDSVVVRYWKDRSIALPYKEAPVVTHVPEPEAEGPSQQAPAGPLPEGDTSSKGPAGANALSSPPTSAETEGPSSEAMPRTVDKVACDKSQLVETKGKPKPSVVMDDAQGDSRDEAGAEPHGEVTRNHVSSAEARAGSPHLASVRHPKPSPTPATSAEGIPRPDAADPSAGATAGGADGSQARPLSTPLDSEPGSSTRQAEMLQNADAVACVKSIAAPDGQKTPLPAPSGEPAQELAFPLLPMSEDPSRRNNGLSMPGQGPLIGSEGTPAQPTHVEPTPPAGDQHMAVVDGGSLTGSEVPGAPDEEGGGRQSLAQLALEAAPGSGSALAEAVDGESLPAGSTLRKGDKMEEGQEEGAQFMHSRLGGGQWRGSAAAKLMAANLLARSGGVCKAKDKALALRSGKQQALASDERADASVASSRTRTIATRNSGRLAHATQVAGSCPCQGSGECEICGQIKDARDPNGHSVIRSKGPGVSTPRPSRSRSGDGVSGERDGKVAVSTSVSREETTPGSGPHAPPPMGAPAAELGATAGGLEGVVPQGKGVSHAGAREALVDAWRAREGCTALDLEEVVDIEESPPHAPVLVLREDKARKIAANRRAKVNGKRVAPSLSPGSELYQARSVPGMLQLPGKDAMLQTDATPADEAPADAVPVGKVRSDELFAFGALKGMPLLQVIAMGKGDAVLFSCTAAVRARWQ